MIIEEREYQQNCVQAVLEHFRNGTRAVMLESPVGSGKTIMGLMILDELNRIAGRKLTCAWVAPRHTLLDQLTEANENFRLSVTPVSMFARSARHYDLVVLDEAHHEATSSFVNLFEQMSPTWLLGLSATPLRTDRMKLAFNETVDLCSIRSLVLDGYLSRFQIFNIDEMTPENAAFHYLRSPEKWGRTIVFMPTIAECRRFHDLLAEQGVDCPVVAGSARIGPALEAFRSGAVKVVVNCQMLSEGFDLPELNTVFLRDASRLPTIQMAGRVLRKHPGKPLANIVQSKQTGYMARKIAPPDAVWNWDGSRFLSVSGKNQFILDVVHDIFARRLERKKIRLHKIWNTGSSQVRIRA